MDIKVNPETDTEKEVLVKVGNYIGSCIKTAAWIIFTALMLLQFAILITS
jgi:hypothetical protein